MQNTVFVHQHYLLFLQNIGENEERRHDTCHLTISLQDKMHCFLDGHEKECYGYILNSNVDHYRCGKNADSFKLVFVFNPCFSKFLSTEDQILYGKNCVELTQEQYKRIVEICKIEFGELNQEVDWASFLPDHVDKIIHTIDEILTVCKIPAEYNLPMDSRIETILNQIDQTETLDHGLAEELCQQIGLSKSRFLHAFKESTGISFKKYIQYIKFFKTWKYLSEGENITEACIHAGYSDSSHYSNFMNQCYGLSTKKELSSVNGVYSLF